MKKLSWALVAVTLLGSGGYLFIYIYRWEWHRALLVGVLFLGALIALSTALVLRRVGRLEQRLSTTTNAPGDAVLGRLQAASVERAPFPWLRPSDVHRTSVFIPILLGGGVVVSAAAWLVERLAGSSARAGVEAELAADLRDIAFPSAVLVPSDAELLAMEGFDDDARVRLLLGPTGLYDGPS
jgi:hypothetical protein